MSPSNFKYFAHKIKTKDGDFDSKKEYQRFLQLNKMLAAGEISDLKLQPSFELIPAQREPDTIGPRGGVKKGKVLERAVNYIADFSYVQNGKLVVEDVKGFRDSTAYDVFVIKRKLLLYLKGIRVKEI